MKKINLHIINLIAALIPLCLILGNSAINIITLVILAVNIKYINYSTIKYQLFFNNYIKILLTTSVPLTLSYFANLEKNQDISLLFASYKIFIFPIIYYLFFLNFKIKFVFIFSTFACFIFLLIDTFVQYKFSVNLTGNNLNEIYNNRRISGIFGSEKILGTYIKNYFPVSLFFIYLLVKNIKYFNIFIICMFTVFSFIAILIIQDRAPFLIFSTVSLIFIGIIFFKYSKKIIFLAILIIGIFFLFLKYDHYLNNRYISIFSLGSGFGKLNFYHPKTDEKSDVEFNFKIAVQNFTIKDSLWGAHYYTAFSIFKDNILFGSGPRSFRIECSKEKYSKLKIKYSDKRCSTHPHNFVFEIMSDLGLIGVIFFLIFFIYNLMLCYEMFFKSKKKSSKFYSMGLLLIIWPLSTTGSVFATKFICFYSIYFALSVSNLQKNFKVISKI